MAFVDDLLAVVGREELALLHVHGLLRGGRRENEVRLAAEERGNLEDVRHLRHDRALLGLVDVRQDREVGLFLDLREDREPLFDPGSPEARAGAPVRLVERGFVDEAVRDAGVRKGLFDRLRHLQGVRA